MLQENEILIPKKQYLEGKVFYADRTDKALKQLQKEGYQAVYMPQLIDARTEADKNSDLWKNWYCTPSIRATGKTKQDNPVVVYCHTNNYFSNPDNITKAIKQGLIKNAGKIPQNEFQRLVDLDEQTDQQGNRLIYVVDYDKLKKSSSGVIPIKKALEHPQTIPFLGGEARAIKYLERHKEFYGDKIGVWHSDDLTEQNPLARLLFVGSIYGGGLSGNDNLGGNARFVGVRAKGASQKILRPSLEQILKVSEDYVAGVNQKEFGSRLKSLFK